MNYKTYKQAYEKVWSDKKLVDKRCDLKHVSIFESTPGSESEYNMLFRDTLKAHQLMNFDFLLKVIWLMRRFSYRNKRRYNMNRNGVELDRAYATYMRYFVGYDTKTVIGNSSIFSKILTYINDFYVNFDEISPFEYSYKYPYQHMTLECLYLVYQMPERLELLDDGEKQNLSYTEFLDYVNNYINCYNEEHGETYEFTFTHQYSPYIKIIKKDEEA